MVEILTIDDSGCTDVSSDAAFVDTMLREIWPIAPLRSYGGMDE